MYNATTRMTLRVKMLNVFTSGVSKKDTTRALKHAKYFRHYYKPQNKPYGYYAHHIVIIYV